MIKILVISAGHNEVNGGIERHCKSLTNMFKNDDVIYIQYKTDLTLKCFPFVHKRYYRWKEICSLVKDCDFDIIHIHGYLHPCAFQLLFISAIYKRKIILSPHFHPFRYIDKPFWGNLYYTFFIKPLLNFVSMIVTLNSDDSHFFRKYNHIMIPHWINSRFTNSNISRKKNLILFVGRNDANKGIEYLYRLPEGLYEVHCVTNGVLQRKDFIQHFNISDDDLTRLYLQASLLVIPSRYEAFSLVALEALVRGCPILISNKVRIADYLDNISGVTIFRYGDYSSFLKMMPLAMDQKVQLEKINDIFSADKIKDVYKKMYVRVSDR